MLRETASGQDIVPVIIMPSSCVFVRVRLTLEHLKKILVDY